MRKIIKVYAAIGGCNIPEKANEFMAFWQSKLDKIPTEFRDNAIIELAAERWYDSASLTVEISYSRPESDSEREGREYRDKLRAAKNKERKIEEYNKLKKELGL